MFHIDPAELGRRRARCRETVARLGRLAREARTECNVCGGKRVAIIAIQDRYGFDIRTALCLTCGLIYLADRFVPQSYESFYGEGDYRRLSGAFNAAQLSIADMQRDQAAYAAEAVRFLEPYIAPGAGTELLDVGGSTGIVARAFAERFHLKATVLDPAEQEIAAARRLGLDGIAGTLESFEGDRRYDMVLLCRSIEHLLDLRTSLRKIRSLIKPDGLFYCDVIDYLESCRLTGAAQTVSKMDHCYWLCQETAARIFRSAGFDIVAANTAGDPTVIGYVLRPVEAAAIDGTASPAIEPMLRRLREIDADWRASAAASRPLSQRLHLAAHRARRRVLRSFSRPAGMELTLDRIPRNS